MNIASAHLAPVSGHILSASVSGGSVFPAVLGFLIVVFLFAAIKEQLQEKDAKRRKAQGLAPKPPAKPRQPMDISPFTASVISGQRESSYKPRGVTAVTPSGIKVTVRCPHRNGHRSPDLAVQCAEREKARIERTGR